MANILKPKAINPPDMLGIMAPASGLKPEVREEGQNYLKSLGFRLKVELNPSGDYDKSSHPFSTAPASARAEAFHRLAGDKDIAAIVAARGGYGSVELLPLLKADVLRKSAPLLVGLSDISILLCWLYQGCNAVTLHAPSLLTYGARAGENAEARESCEVLLNFISGRVANPYEGLEFQALNSVSEGEGRLIGGNLTSLCSVIGTPWEPDFTDHILFLEDIGEKPYRIHRMLTQLKLAGKLDGLKGVLLGDFTDCDIPNCPEAATVSDVTAQIFAGCSYPVLSGLPFGHADKSFPVPVGIKAGIFQNKLEFLEKTILD